MNKHYLNPKVYKENKHASLRRFTIGSATLLLSVLLYASNGENRAQAAETNQNNNQNTAVSPSSSQNNTVSEELNFQVQRDGSNEVSHMDEYMKHPGKVIKKDNQYYFQATLTNASWWKEYKFFDKNNQELTTNVVNDDTANDTKTLNISVEPGYTNITSRIHIVIPNLKYDHTYTTHLEFAKPIPTLGETNSDSNTATQPNNDVVTTPDTGDNNNGATAPSTGDNNNASTTPNTGDNNNAPTTPNTGDNNNAPTTPATGDNNNASTTPNTGDNNNGATNTNTGDNNNASTTPNTGDNNNGATNTNTGDNNNASTTPNTGDNNNVPTTPDTGDNNNNRTNTNTGANVGKDGKDGKGGKTGKKEDEGKGSKTNQNNSSDKDVKNSQNSDDNKSKELPDTGKAASRSYFNELAMATIALFTSITMFVFRRKHSK